MPTVNSEPKLPPWFGKPIPTGYGPRRDFYICTECGGQSCGGIYSSTCTRCGGISSDPPHGVRYDYLCRDQITKTLE
ncbi:unnamed protein product [Rotaria sordida]|uniref:Uncharacterized protein n=1 Tax=Rotaria sordida TaxID=392033 RepID=A0A819R3B2_9BILA|nr:unnamed protein product [Rotaria sordida]CAF1505923.1 unnamed protein product [Rotaria sordida]CAF4009855.1 unnamed protein product [Rotaria sordida]CAF4033946.1 unnamed protein product [Rotaria sordida]